MTAAFLVVSIIGLLIWLLLTTRARQKGDGRPTPDPIEVHAIRRRLDVAWYRQETKRDAGALRRELDHELDGEDS